MIFFAMKGYQDSKNISLFLNMFNTIFSKDSNVTYYIIKLIISFICNWKFLSLWIEANQVSFIKYMLYLKL